MSQGVSPDQKSPITQETNVIQNTKSKIYWIRGVATVILLIILILAIVWYFKYQSTTEYTEDAYVDGNVVQLTSQIAGTVINFAADNTDYVKSGELVVQLNSVDQEILFERTKAELAKAIRNARTQYSQVYQLQAEVEQRQNEVLKAKEDLKRRSDLAAIGAISSEELSHAQDQLKNAQAALIAENQSLIQSRAIVDGTSLRTHPDVLTAVTNLRDAYVSRMRTSISSPVDGIVTKRSVQLGQHINPGVALMSIVPTNELWVNANFKESQLKHLRIGQPVELTSDVYGRNVLYHGKIVGLDAGTGSAFALLPAQNATGNWIKVTQRVSVRIALDPQEIIKNPLRIGLSMRVTVDTSDRNGEIIRQNAAPTFKYKTQIYDHELKDADRIVESIIRENEGNSPQKKQI